VKHLTRAVWILSFVSLFTDIASEMLYPVMPLYLQSIGFSLALIGVLEGIAEATSGLSKGYFGNLSDASGKRAPFIRSGYLLSSIAKPLLALSVYPLWIFFSRTLDRLGKGLRTGARDAMLSDESTPQTKARVFGFHRSMDTLGAVIGPCLALGYLAIYPGNYKALFVITLLPGICAFLLLLLIKDKFREPRTSQKVSFLSYFRYWKRSPVLYRKVAGGLLLFALFNSSDMFLLLKAKQTGLDDSWLIGLYIFYNLVYAAAAYPLGIIADRIGLKSILSAGLLLFGITYFGMAFCNERSILFALFFLYGLYSAATEGISKAWISNIVANSDTATAIGTFAGFQSICLMLASSLTGLIWYLFGSVAAFGLSALAAVGVAFYLLLFCNQSNASIK
jgi:MFS family permease